MTSSSLINQKKSMHHFNMRHGSLFSGIGGFDLASEWMGWENVFHCEWNPFGQKVLNYYWPKAISYHDITKTDFSIHRGQIDIITGGFPCQPYSMAGKRKGKEDERHLWPEMLRCIREVQPTWIVGENVLGLVNWNEGMVFEEVQVDLEAEGYTVQPYVLPAASVNAPHRRDRVWFVAYNHKFGCERYAEQIRDRRDSQKQIGGIDICEKQGWDEIRCLNEGSSKNRRNATDSSGIGQECREERERSKRGTQPNDKQFKGCSKLPGTDFQMFPSVPSICHGDDGLSDRLDSITFSKWRQESIKAGGNAIVPQVVHQIFKAIQQYNDLEK
jgi:DNA (cytosine-5)-methyltransferase 1